MSSDWPSEHPPRTPFSRDRWPEYADALGLDRRAHRRLAESIIDRDAPKVPQGDWARRFDISGTGRALMEVYPLGGGTRDRFAVYPINLSLTGVGVANSAHVPPGSRVWLHFDRLVSGEVSLLGEVRRSVPIDDRAWLIGMSWTEESRKRLIEHVGPVQSDAALREPPLPQTDEQEVIDAAYRSLYAEGRLGAWAAAVRGD